MAAPPDSGAPVPPVVAASPFPSLGVAHNDGGWGPLPSSVPSGFAMSPFAAFSRSERLGKAADFGSFLSMRQRGQFRRGMDENVDLGGALYEAGDSEFVMVDTSKTPRRGGYNRGGRGGPRGGMRGGRGGSVNIGARGWEDKQSERKGSDGTSFNKRYNKLTRARWVQQNSMRGGPRLLRDASVRVSNDWLQLEIFDLAQLAKLQITPSKPEDLRWCGHLDVYDEDFDRSSAKKPIRLRDFPKKVSKSVGSVLDPVFMELANDGAGNVFVSEGVIGHLMAAGRSLYPWDIVVNYVGGTIFLDARVPQEMDMHSVNENSHVPPPEEDPEDINGRDRLAFEATVINHDFSQQVLMPNSKPGVAPEAAAPNSGEPVMSAPNPFIDAAELNEGEEPASGALRYRRWHLGADTSVVVRTSVHAVSRKRSETTKAGAPAASSLLKIYTLNEWDPRAPGAPADWRKVVDTQRGNVLATEMKNNGFKLAKFTAMTLLSGADVLKLGFVSRQQKGDPEAHVVIGMHTLSPPTFAHQMSLDTNNMWGIVKWLVELVRKHAANLQSAESGDSEEAAEGAEPGSAAAAAAAAERAAAAENYQAKFVLLRDPNFPRLYLYNVPLEAFENADEGEGEGDEAWAPGEGNGGAAGGVGEREAAGNGAAAASTA